MIDTPGYFDFVGEANRVIKSFRWCLVVVCAASGVEVGTVQVWDYSEEMAIPKVIMVNKMDRENADFNKTLSFKRSLANKGGAYYYSYWF